MGYASASFDPAMVALTSDAASSAFDEANAASAVAAAASSRIAESSATWEAAGAGAGYRGSAVFNTISGVTVAIGATLGDSNYTPALTPRGSSVANIGPIGIVNKTVSSFDVVNLGSESSVIFDWMLNAGTLSSAAADGASALSKIAAGSATWDKASAASSIAAIANAKASDASSAVAARSAAWDGAATKAAAASTAASSALLMTANVSAFSTAIVANASNIVLAAGKASDASSAVAARSATWDKASAASAAVIVNASAASDAASAAAAAAGKASTASSAVAARSSIWDKASGASSVAAVATTKAAAASTAASSALAIIAAQSASWENVVNDTTPQLGGNLDINEKRIVHEFGTLAGDHSAAGDIINATAGESLSFGRTCYFKSDKKFWKTDADASATAKGMIGLCLETLAAESAGDFLLKGLARDDTWAWTSAAELFLHTSQGEMSETAPSGNADIVRLAGYARAADYVWFEPSKTYLQISSA